MDHHHETAMSSPHEAMAHSGDEAMSMEGMVQDMRNRFLVAAVLSVPILLWSAIVARFCISASPRRLPCATMSSS